MNSSTLTSKGQVTIPAAVRTALDLAAGDRLFFVVEGDRLIITPMRRRRLSELYGVLPATRSYPGTQETRKAVGARLGADLEQRDSE